MTSQNRDSIHRVILCETDWNVLLSFVLWQQSNLYCSRPSTPTTDQENGYVLFKFGASVWPAIRIWICLFECKLQLRIAWLSIKHVWERIQQMLFQSPGYFFILSKALFSLWPKPDVLQNQVNQVLQIRIVHIVHKDLYTWRTCSFDL